MARIFGRWINRLTGRNDVTETELNRFNRAFYKWIGGQSAQYDHRASTYLKQGYGHNPDVYAIISQQAEKIKSVPYSIRNIEDDEAKSRLDKLELATKGNLKGVQKLKQLQLKDLAFKEEDKPFPLKQPNPNQTWAEIWALYEVFMQTTGNFYLYMLSPDEGVNMDVPRQVYVLPSHLMKINLKREVDVLTDDNPIKSYSLIYGDNYIDFDCEDVIHVKLPNPFYDFAGSHLYGLSPLKSVLRNIESSNDALDHNVKALKNGGVFGFISAKNDKQPLQPEQAKQIKERLREMDASPERLSKIAGLSVPVEFTRLSLNTEELKPFDYLKYNQKTIANVLGWSDKLLNNDDGAKYDNLKIAQRNVVINHIIPRLNLLEEALNKHFITRFRGYENSLIEWDYGDLPEMQEEMKDLKEKYEGAPITLNEFRKILGFEELDVDGMDIPYVDGNKRRVDEAGLSDDELQQGFNQLSNL